jgi:hypothetical protein
VAQAALPARLTEQDIKDCAFVFDTPPVPPEGSEPIMYNFYDGGSDDGSGSGSGSGSGMGSGPDPCAASCPTGICDGPADASKPECAACAACHGMQGAWPPPPPPSGSSRSWVLWACALGANR